MPKLAELPVELLITIVSLLDRPSLRSVRLTSRWLAPLATSSLFETLHLFAMLKSIRKVGYILQDSALTDCVRRVYIMTYKREWDSEAQEQSNPIEPSQNILTQIAAACSFPRLRHIAVCFDRHCFREVNRHRYSGNLPPQGEAFRKIVLQWLFRFSGTAKRRPESLTVQNIQDVTPSSMSPLTKQLLEGLKELRLHIVHEPSRNTFFTSSESILTKLPSILLSPTTSTLQHLSLYSDQRFGHKPALDLSKIHFPRLKSLAFGQYAFFHDFQLDWILSHGSTLQELYLDNCSILPMVICSCKEDINKFHPYLRDKYRWEEVFLNRDFPSLGYRYRTRWHDYFTSFRDGLPHLRHFRIGKGEWKKSAWNIVVPFEKEHEIKIGLFHSRYCVHWQEYVDTSAAFLAEELREQHSWDGKDNEALWSLLKKIGQTVGKHELAGKNVLQDEITFWR